MDPVPGSSPFSWSLFRIGGRCRGRETEGRGVPLPECRGPEARIISGYSFFFVWLHNAVKNTRQEFGTRQTSLELSGTVDVGGTALVSWLDNVPAEVRRYIKASPGPRQLEGHSRQVSDSNLRFSGIHPFFSLPLERLLPLFFPLPIRTPTPAVPLLCPPPTEVPRRPG